MPTHREIQNVKDLLQQYGFGDIHFEKASIPEHIMDLLKNDGPPPTDEQMKNMEEDGAYQKIKTAQGSFSIFLCPYPFLDLAGTGIRAQDITNNSDDPPFLLELGKEKNLFHFRKLLEFSAKNI